MHTVSIIFYFIFLYFSFTRVPFIEIFKLHKNLNIFLFAGSNEDCGDDGEEFRNVGESGI